MDDDDDGDDDDDHDEDDGGVLFDPVCALCDNGGELLWYAHNFYSFVLCVHKDLSPRRNIRISNLTLFNSSMQAFFCEFDFLLLKDIRSTDTLYV